ncbi:hypothetical protein [Roseococcus sp. YIM B11640]|uniref:hypothetical protein n=1 Tax=Roseococcus sp. YIM B11640 TaxID=3133973 RepID=UPI003C7E3D19
MKTFMMATAIAAATLGMTALPMRDAAAQTAPASYCHNRIQAVSFYGSVASDGRTSTVSYYVILQNRTGEPVHFAVAFNATQAQNRPNGTMFSTLGPWGNSGPILLGIDRFNNPSGSGALSNVYDLPPATQVVCR